MLTITVSYDAATRELLLDDPRPYGGSTIDNDSVTIKVIGVPVGYDAQIDFAVQLFNPDTGLDYRPFLPLEADGSCILTRDILHAASRDKILPFQLHLKNGDEVINSRNTIKLLVSRAIDADRTVVSAFQPNLMLKNDKWNWLNNLTYKAGSITLYNGKLYLSLQDNNLNFNPESRTDFWSEISGGGGGTCHVPAGGTTGQVLAKRSNADFDLQWANQSAGTNKFADLVDDPRDNDLLAGEFEVTDDHMADSDIHVSAAEKAEWNAKLGPGDVYTKTETDALLDGKANADEVYDKTETDNLLADKADVGASYTKTEEDALLADKADSDSVYSKTESDAQFATKTEIGDFYDKSEVDAKLLLKADASNVYTKSETYTKTETDTALAPKADKTTTYTKTETDTLLGTKADQSTTYTKTEVDAALNLKQNALPTTAVGGKVLTSTTTAGTVQWTDLPAPQWGSIEGDMLSQTDLMTALTDLADGMTELGNTKQDVLTAGAGITIAADGTISAEVGLSVDLDTYYSRGSPPNPSDPGTANVIYIFHDVPTAGANAQYMCSPIGSGVYNWVFIGTTDVEFAKDTIVQNTTNLVENQAVYNALLLKQDKLPNSTAADYVLTATNTTGGYAWKIVPSAPVTDVKVDGASVVTSGVANINGKEDASNKVIAFASATDTQYPSAKLVKDNLDLKQDKLGNSTAADYVLTATDTIGGLQWKALPVTDVKVDGSSIVSGGIADLGDTLDNYVDLTSEQTITGRKSFGIMSADKLYFGSVFVDNASLSQLLATVSGLAAEMPNKQPMLPTTTTAGMVLTSTGTAGTVEWAEAESGVTDVTLDGTSVVTDGVAVLENLESTDNKVIAFQATPDDDHYPSEKLVYNSFEMVTQGLNDLQDGLTEHVSNGTVHVTAADKTAWSSKVDYDDVYLKDDVDDLLEDKINVSISETLVKAFVPSISTSGVHIDAQYVNTSTGAVTTAGFNLPIASTTQTGFMTSTDMLTFERHGTDIAALQGRAVIYVVQLSTTTPTQAELTEAYDEKSGETGPPTSDGTTLVDTTNKKEYRYYLSESQWVDMGSPSVAIATDSTVGIVQGTAYDGTEDTAGKIHVESDGTMSVNGFDDLVAVLGTKASETEFQQGKAAIQERGVLYSGSSSIASGSWTSSGLTTYIYKATISVTNLTANANAMITFNETEALSGNYAPFCDTVSGGIVIYCKTAPTSSITVSYMAIQKETM